MWVVTSPALIIHVIIKLPERNFSACYAELYNEVKPQTIHLLPLKRAPFIFSTTRQHNAKRVRKLCKNKAFEHVSETIADADSNGNPFGEVQEMFRSEKYYSK